MNLENDILIDNYLRGLLDENEVIDFELRLQSEVEFRKYFELEQALWLSQNDKYWSFATYKDEEVEVYKKLLMEEDLQNLKKTLKQINSEFKEESTKKVRPKFYYFAAASIVILICLSIFLRQDVSNQDLVNDYLNTSNLPSFVSRGDKSINDLIEAQRFFENEHYQKALDIFVPVLEIVDTNASIYVYIGIAQMKLEKYTAAESTFDSLIHADLLDAQKGHWYKALLYIKQNKIDEAKIVLNAIISQSLFNHEEATELLTKLDD